MATREVPKRDRPYRPPLDTSRLASALLGGSSGAPVPTLHWATVTETTPLTVSMAGGDTLAVTSNACGPLAVGDRVFCAWAGSSLVAVASPTQMQRITGGDVPWTAIPTNAGHTGSPAVTVRSGVAYWRGLVTRAAGNFGASYVQICQAPTWARPAQNTDPYPSNTTGAGDMGIIRALSGGQVQAASTNSARVSLSALSYPVG